MKKVNFFTSTFALLFGSFIFGASLIMSSQVKLHNSPKVSERRFYMGERILPDHVFYPLLMIADKIILKTSTGNRKIYVKIRLSDDRLNSSMMLLEKNQESLALSAMTKSQKYLITAAQDFLSSKIKSDLVRKDLLIALNDNMIELEKCQGKFKTINASPISDLLIESSALIGQIKN
ncbi:hypothetical protein KKD03_00690 [Patescibacteria group bacterium]|nr:hypothetical protein [Patescibacteria group bacterium]